MDLTVAIRSTVFEDTDKFVSIHKCNTASMLKTTIDNATRVSTVFLFALLSLEEVTILVLNLSAAISLIEDKLSVIESSVVKSHLTSTDSLIIVPLTLKHLTIAVVACALAMSPVVAVAAFVVASILKHNLDSPIDWHSSVFESALKDLILTRVENSWPMRLVFSPLALVESPALEFAEANAASDSIFEVASIQVSIFHVHHAHA